MFRLPAALLAAVTAVGVGAPVVGAEADIPVYREYVALGDSYTADVFTSLPPTTEFVPFNCDQSATDYPHQVAAALRVGVFRDASCGGAKTDNMAGPQTVPLGVNPPQFDRLTPTTDLVTVSIGGNDLRLQELIDRCRDLGTLLPGASTSNSNGCQDSHDAFAALVAATTPKVTAVLAQIRERSPRARVLLVNYLNAVPTDGTSCPPSLPVHDDDVAYLASTMADLNTMLARVAAEAHVQLVDTYGPSLGHDVCQSPEDRYIEGLIPFSPKNPQLLAFPFHPNAAGASAQTRAVLAAITDR
ncbi:SGNH/GDSL hydrolase family protein [Nocardia sp. NPDC049149]|uniref:SGNH/GDSL hydrolase family protein n=1 Tax=Nocardia sp. NPDC049149 TaxID=3364315 RepID=UPI00371BBA44